MMTGTLVQHLLTGRPFCLAKDTAYRGIHRDLLHSPLPKYTPGRIVRNHPLAVAPPACFVMPGRSASGSQAASLGTISASWGLANRNKRREPVPGGECKLLLGGGWRGTCPCQARDGFGIVKVSAAPPGAIRRSFTWLPRCEKTSNPNRRSMAMTSPPERRLSRGR
jgi:hypothetical protein